MEISSGGEEKSRKTNDGKINPAKGQFSRGLPSARDYDYNGVSREFENIGIFLRRLEDDEISLAQGRPAPAQSHSREEF